MIFSNWLSCRLLPRGLLGHAYQQLILPEMTACAQLESPVEFAVLLEEKGYERKLGEGYWTLALGSFTALGRMDGWEGALYL